MMTSGRTKSPNPDRFSVNWYGGAGPRPGGRTKSPNPDRFSVNWYGGAIPTQGYRSRVAEIPVFDGFRQCRVPSPTGTRTRTLEPIATTVAKTIGPSRSLA